MSTKYIDKFYGGMVRDEKSTTPGVCLNVEELDIFENANYIQPSQIMTADAMPATTEIYAYTGDSADTVFGYGKETAGGKVRIVSVATGGATNPGAFGTLFTAASVLCYPPSPIVSHKLASGTENLYWLSISGSTVSLNSCTTAGASEASVGTLTGLDGTNDRLSFRRIYGGIFIANGKYIASVDKDGVFTNAAFTLPTGWEAVDICEAGSGAVVLARSVVANANSCKGFFWDLTSLTTFDDSFDIPFGGPQWIQKHRETIKIMCAINGEARFYQLSGAFAGGIPNALPGLVMKNVATESDEVPISAQKMVSTKDDILYFAVYKTDKSGIYAIGQLDYNKSQALVLAKRFDTSSYATHIPKGLYIQGPNFYGAFTDNGAADNTRCESLNSPTRSSNAVYESVILDDGNPTAMKKLSEVFAVTQPLPASTSIACSVANDYGSYAAITRADGTALNTTGALIGQFQPKSSSNIKSFQIKLAFTSSGTSAAKLVGLGYTSMNMPSTARK